MTVVRSGPSVLIRASCNAMPAWNRSGSGSCPEALGWTLVASTVAQRGVGHGGVDGHCQERSRNAAFSSPGFTGPPAHRIAPEARTIGWRRIRVEPDPNSVGIRGSADSPPEMQSE
jgi:hypothetical protein